MNKKAGIARYALFGLLLVGVLIVLFLILGFKTIEGFNVVGDVELCRSSVRLASYEFKAFKIPGVDLHLVSKDSPVNIHCKTQYIDLKKDTIPLAEGNVKLGSNKDFNKDKLKQFVFEQLATCWYQFGDGQVAVQKAKKGVDTRACIVCSEIIPDKKFIEGDTKLPFLKDDEKFGNIVLDDLYTDAETRKNSAGKSYLKYLTGDGLDLQDAASYPKREIQFNKPYFVVFQVMDRRVAKADVDSGIIDCSVGDKRKLTGDNANEVGCDKNGDLDGINFGKVIGVDNEGTISVRIVPASGVTADTCKRLI
ncbi:hypothetical protein CMO88_01860 [Candidatus Woesearchaeota archaeon]|nr:hypothetical protein [Candidatus Woesearchaeota archaeon]